VIRPRLAVDSTARLGETFLLFVGRGALGLMLGAPAGGLLSAMVRTQCVNR
jgi:hypothetical protein